MKFGVIYNTGHHGTDLARHLRGGGEVTGQIQASALAEVTGNSNI